MQVPSHYCSTPHADRIQFFTYGELVYWFIFVILVNPFRWKWALFVLFGIGSSLPLAIVQQEDKFRSLTNGKRVNGDSS